MARSASPSAMSASLLAADLEALREIRAITDRILDAHDPSLEQCEDALDEIHALACSDEDEDE